MTCAYFATSDSGLMNIANALDIPMTALLGPASSWLDLRKDCAPCEVTTSGKSSGRANVAASPS